MAVIGLEITRQGVIAEGQMFDDVGAYEQLTGTVRFAVDSGQQDGTDVTDLDLASREEDDRVHFSADFALLRPIELARSSGRLLFSVLNRGRKTIPFNDAPALGADQPVPWEPAIGNGFLMRSGYIVAWCGWQHDVPVNLGRMAIVPPFAQRNARPITGPVLCEFQPDAHSQVLMLSDRLHQAYPAADLAAATPTLTVRDSTEGPRRVIPRGRWQFARLQDGQLVSDPRHIFLEDAFEAGKLYELVYTALGAPVVGTGLLATRDLVSWLRYSEMTDGNPVAGVIRYAYAHGISQSGRFLRQLLYLDLNVDANGRVVFDGLIPEVTGARRGEFNLRFGQPSKITSEGVGALFPFSDVTQTDPVTGRADGLLARATARGPLPKIMAINSAAEYWGGDRGSGGQASLLHTDVEGKRDVEPPDTTRIYLIAGAQHGAGTVPPQSTSPYGAPVLHQMNSLDFGPLRRALLVALDRWVSAGETPPPSRHPRLDDATAVPPQQVLERFRAIPGVRVPTRAPRLHRLDLGPVNAPGILEAPQLPPQLGKPFLHFVSAVDADGNEVAGIRLPEVEVPLATYAGWNVRHPTAGAPDHLVPMAGSTFPFPNSEAQRRALNDPRPSIKERYSSKESYLKLVRQAALKLLEERYLLEEDMEPIIERAARRWALYMAEA